jgi:hypothetical protein
MQLLVAPPGRLVQLLLAPPLRLVQPLLAPPQQQLPPLQSAPRCSCLPAPGCRLPGLPQLRLAQLPRGCRPPLTPGLLPQLRLAQLPQPLSPGLHCPPRPWLLLSWHLHHPQELLWILPLLFLVVLTRLLLPHWLPMLLWLLAQLQLQP